MSLRPLKATSEMTSFTTSIDARHKASLGPLLCSSATHRDMTFGHPATPIVRVCPTSLHSGIAVWSPSGTRHVYVLHVFLPRLAHQSGTQPTSCASSQVPTVVQRLQLLCNEKTFANSNFAASASAASDISARRPCWLDINLWSMMLAPAQSLPSVCVDPFQVRHSCSRASANLFRTPGVVYVLDLLAELRALQLVELLHLSEHAACGCKHWSPHPSLTAQPCTAAPDVVRRSRNQARTSVAV